MRFQYSTVLALLAASASAELLGRAVPSRCAVAEPSEQQKKEAKALFEVEKAQAREGNLRQAAIAVDVYFHVISSAKSKFITVGQLHCETFSALT